jgi:hypothetical protein
LEPAEADAAGAAGAGARAQRTATQTVVASSAATAARRARTAEQKRAKAKASALRVGCRAAGIWPPVVSEAGPSSPEERRRQEACGRGDQAYAADDFELATRCFQGALDSLQREQLAELGGLNI